MIVKNNPRFSILTILLGLVLTKLWGSIGLWILTITLRISTGIVRLRWRLGVILGNGTICSTILMRISIWIFCMGISGHFMLESSIIFIYSHLHNETSSFCLISFMKFTHYSLKFLQKLQNSKMKDIFVVMLKYKLSY